MLAFACLCIASAQEAQISLFNGDFEAQAVGIDGAPVGWHRYQGTPATGVVSLDLLRVHSGAQALRITDESPANGYAVRSRFYPAIPGQTYQASAWVYNGKGDGWLYLEFHADATRRVSEKHAGSGKVGSWEQVVLEDVCPPRARYVTVLLYSAVHNVGQSAWDDVTLTGPLGDGEPIQPDQMWEVPVDYSYLRNVGDRKQLLFDDAFLQSHHGFWWRICPPRKTGERNLVADKPWESFIVNAWCTVMEDEGRYRMWYEAYDKTYSSDYDARYCYAESADGIHWEKPSLGLVEFDGSRDNNIVFHKFGERSVHGGTVFKDPNAPAHERYKFVFLSNDGAVWGAVSPDGIHWNLCDHGPILHVGSDTQTVCFWDDRLSRYVIYCRLWDPTRSVGRAESTDFRAFPDASRVLACDAKDPDDADLYNNAALKYPWADNAYFIFTSMYHHNADNLDVHLAVSRDGIHWWRPERRPFIPNGEPGAMDDTSVYCGVGALKMGEEIWMYYHASRCKHNEVYPQNQSYDGVITRAVLRLDRYVAMNAGLVPAELITHPLTFTGTRLELNADVRPGGFVRVALEDTEGNSLPGFALDDCVPVEGDSVRHVVRWTGGQDLSALAGRPVRMRIVARDASLFAFQFAPPE